MTVVLLWPTASYPEDVNKPNLSIRPAPLPLSRQISRARKRWLKGSWAFLTLRSGPGDYTVSKNDCPTQRYTAYYPCVGQNLWSVVIRSISLHYMLTKITLVNCVTPRLIYEPSDCGITCQAIWLKSTSKSALCHIASRPSLSSTWSPATIASLFSLKCFKHALPPGSLYLPFPPLETFFSQYLHEFSPHLLPVSPPNTYTMLWLFLCYFYVHIVCALCEFTNHIHAEAHRLEESIVPWK